MCSLLLIPLVFVGVVLSDPLLSHIEPSSSTDILSNISPSLNSTIAQSSTLANQSMHETNLSHVAAFGPIRASMLESEVANFGASFSFAPKALDHFGAGTLYDFSFACEFASGPVRGRPGHIENISVDGKVTQRSPHENIARATPQPGGTGHVPFYLPRGMWVTIQLSLSPNYPQHCQFILWRITAE
ncbi:hypothetical protein N7G274_008956 [Stereocaulon virgatum]|uniref:Uncharacterized protein n=1 Tax=Stereocaulon virgatum TaxID=373712 RepID=A0ABR3ZX96_9LECA